MDDRELLKAVYKAIAWDDLYRLAPDAKREQVEDLFRRLHEALPRVKAQQPADAPAPARAKAAAGPVRKVILNCDGACSGNPGPAGIGMVLSAEDETELQAWGEAIGHATNNVAEYRALIAGLRRALEIGAREIQVRSDSELLVCQITGRYRVKNAALKELHAEAVSLLTQFEGWRAAYVAREENAHADKLAGTAVKESKSASC